MARLARAQKPPNLREQQRCPAESRAELKRKREMLQAWLFLALLQGGNPSPPSPRNHTWQAEICRWQGPSCAPCACSELGVRTGESQGGAMNTARGAPVAGLLPIGVARRGGKGSQAREGRGSPSHTNELAFSKHFLSLGSSIQAFSWGADNGASVLPALLTKQSNAFTPPYTSSPSPQAWPDPGQLSLAVSNICSLQRSSGGASAHVSLLSWAAEHRLPEFHRASMAARVAGKQRASHSDASPLQNMVLPSLD